MTPEDLINRLNRIEKKLDKHLEITSTNAADINWVKGYIKTSASVFAAVIAGIVTAFIKLLDN